jgi:outer membrane protein assembly factor BamB
MRTTLLSLSQKLRRNPGYLVLLALVLAAVYGILHPGDWNPKHRRGLVSLSSSVQLEWQTPAGWLAAPPAADSKAVCLFHGGSDSLVAKDLRSGAELWSFTSGMVAGHTYGTRSVLTDGDTVYALTATTASAFSTTTGAELWATELGYGHVRVVPQLTPTSLRVYYGDTVIDLDRDTGQIARREESSILLWRTQGIDLVQQSPKLQAFNTAAATEVWRSYLPRVLILEDMPPLDLPGAILAPIETRELCRLSLASGRLEWCTQTQPTSNAAVVQSLARAYLIDDARQLLEVDLRTGDTTPLAAFPVVEGKAPDPTRYAFHDYVAVSSGTLIVYLGDTYQLLALRVNDHD